LFLRQAAGGAGFDQGEHFLAVGGVGHSWAYQAPKLARASTCLQDGVGRRVT
jgi:hypothetical protein